MEKSCEIILKSGHWSMRICRLKSGGHFVQLNGTILSIYKESHFVFVTLTLDLKFMTANLFKIMLY